MYTYAHACANNIFCTIIIELCIYICTYECMYVCIITFVIFLCVFGMLVCLYQTFVHVLFYKIAVLGLLFPFTLVNKTWLAGM